MSPSKTEERSTGICLVALYFVVAGFLESIQKFREWGSVILWNPLAEHSIWHLATHTLIYLTVAYLVWQLTWLGRLAALVYGYLILTTYLAAFLLYLGGAAMTFSSLSALLAVYHLAALPPLVLYMQPSRRKKLFKVSVLEILLPHD